MKRSRYVDLFGEGLNLEKQFDFIIHRIPDLCKPAAIRLAGERDYFNETKSFKLEPFKKQNVFDKCIRQEQKRDELNEEDTIESTQYPYANPMPKCMLTNGNMDNLRSIIVSSLDIEWRMLTPKRPENDYELEYFDKLISLHRHRFRQCLIDSSSRRLSTDPMSGASLVDTHVNHHHLPFFPIANNTHFRHIRHRQVSIIRGQNHHPGQNRQLKIGAMCELHSSVCCLGVKLKKKFSCSRHRRESRLSSSLGQNCVLQSGGRQLTIPKLTLTATIESDIEGEEDRSERTNDERTIVEPGSVEEEHANACEKHGGEGYTTRVGAGNSSYEFSRRSRAATGGGVLDSVAQFGANDDGNTVGMINREGRVEGGANLESNDEDKLNQIIAELLIGASSGNGKR